MHTTKFTKIVATIGPASESPAVMGALLDAGVNIFRFNTKHNTPDWHATHIREAQQVADQKGITLGILLDLQGPEIRLETKGGASISVITGQTLRLGLSFRPGIEIIIPHALVFSLLHPGDPLLIDDGFVETEVLSVSEEEITVKVKNDAIIKHRKGVNIPGKDIDFPALIDSDIAELRGNAASKIDYVGLSFVRSAKDIALLRSELVNHGIKAKIVGKIESQPALDRIDEIIASADAIMVARGDLGVEVPIEQLAYWQQTIIEKCRIANKPVITATQMLESMISNPRPTRAEATDVAHAIFDGTDAIMLSGETASGGYPVRTVETMARIAHWNENHHPFSLSHFVSTDATSAIAEAAIHIVSSSVTPAIDAVIVFTETGFSAKAIARYRLKIPIIAVTGRQATAESLTISYGVTPVVTQFPTGLFTTPDAVLHDLLDKSILHEGSTVLIVHGHTWQAAGLTNALQIVTI